ncbi:hypothetical protein [Pedobacter psychrodurus]|nr:hypothetical protein [Pedobacter psychrodurus]
MKTGFFADGVYSGAKRTGGYDGKNGKAKALGKGSNGISRHQGQDQ